MTQPSISTADIELRARERADMVNSDFVSAAEVTRYCEKAFQEWIGILLTKEPDLLVTKSTGNANPPPDFFQLPSHYKALRRIRHVDSYSLRRAELQEMEVLSFNGRRGKPTHYYLYNGYTNPQPLSQIVFLPYPDRVYPVEVWFIPSLSLADVINGGLNLIAGWDEYVVLTAAMKMKDKEESDVSVLVGERTTLLEATIAQITAQDTGEPGRMTTFSPNPFYNDPFDIEDRYGL